MAHDKSIDELERDVEQARARVAADIALLRSPETFEAAKSGIMDAALGYRDQMRDKATSYGDGWMDQLKAKAAANPLAVAAIGAGVAWRLYKHPPITTVLVGLGLASLMRTDSHDDSMHPRRLLETASGKAMELKDRAAAQLAELRENTIGGADESAHDLRANGEGVRESGVRSYAMAEGERDFADRHDGVKATGGRRDAYLLGVAALAVGAAVGMSRLHGSDEVDPDVEHDAFDEGRDIVWRRY